MNKDFLLDQLGYVCKLLNDNNIDFYVVGALGGYIACNLEIQRRHYDIDLMILEEDISKIKAIFKGTDYLLYDNRANSKKILNQFGYTEGEEHEVYAQYKNSNFHIGFFMYTINDDCYSLIEYFNDHGIPKRLIRTLPIKYFYYQYDSNYKYYYGIRLKTATVECIYNNKKYMTRDKDIFDNKVFKKHINSDVINQMTGKSKYRIIIIEDI